MKIIVQALCLAVVANVSLMEKVSGQPVPPPVHTYLPPPTIDPLTGEPASTSSPPLMLDLTTGLRVPASSLDNGDAWSGSVMFDLIYKGNYDDAMQRIRKVREQPINSNTLGEVQHYWQMLAQKYPPARQALVNRRDQDIRELSSGGGDGNLFKEMVLINDYLDQNFITVTVFEAVHRQNPDLAKWCYPDAENSLLRKGEYALCREYYSAPRANFQSYTSRLENMRKTLPPWQKSQRESQQRFDHSRLENEANVQRAWQSSRDHLAQAEQLRQERWQQEATNLPDHNLTPPPPRPLPASLTLVQPPKVTYPTFKSFDMGEVETNYFVNHVRVLVEILANTGDQAEAQKIQTEAVAILDDPRLRMTPSGSNKNPEMKPDHSF